MEKSDFQLVLKKLDIKDEDIYSYEENWPQQTVLVDSVPQVVKSNIKWCTITTRSGRKFIFKMNSLSKVIRTIDETGYDLMVE